MVILLSIFRFLGIFHPKAQIRLKVGRKQLESGSRIA